MKCLAKVAVRARAAWAMGAWLVEMLQDESIKKEPALLLLDDVAAGKGATCFGTRPNSWLVTRNHQIRAQTNLTSPLKLDSSSHGLAQWVHSFLGEWHHTPSTPAPQCCHAAFDPSQHIVLAPTGPGALPTCRWDSHHSKPRGACW